MYCRQQQHLGQVWSVVMAPPVLTFTSLRVNVSAATSACCKRGLNIYIKALCLFNGTPSFTCLSVYSPLLPHSQLLNLPLTDKSCVSYILAGKETWAPPHIKPSLKGRCHRRGNYRKLLRVFRKKINLCCRPSRKKCIETTGTLVETCWMCTRRQLWVFK